MRNTIQADAWLFLVLFFDLLFGVVQKPDIENILYK